MADEKPSTRYYQLKGINQKSSKYEFPVAEFLDLRNVDFDVPNAHQKRPGSTFAIGSSLGTSGPITALYEFVKLTGESYIVAASDTALFFRNANSGGFSLLSPNWNNGQPPDMLTFVNKMWAANGQSFSWFDGTTFTPAGLPVEIKTSVLTNAGFTTSFLFTPSSFNSTGGTYFLVNGATAIMSPGGASNVARAVYVAYSYNRSDGYVGPADFQKTARNVVMTSPGNATEFFSNVTNTNVGGFTIPPGRGITSISIWFAEDTISTAANAQTENIPGIGVVKTGALGWADIHANKFFGSYTLKPGADLSRFWLFTTMPTSNLFLTTDGLATYYAATFIPGNTFSAYDGIADPSFGFSGNTFDFFTTYIPKYIEVEQNIMFMAGFSSSPSTLWYSEVGQPEVLLPESSFEVRTDDGDRILATKNFNSNLIIMKETSFHKLIGNSSDNFQLVQLSNEYGCLSNKTVIQVKQSLYWLDRKGILEFNGASFDIISTEVEGIFRRMNLDAAREKACAAHHLYRNQIWFSIPIDGSTRNNMTVVYDYLVGAWTFFDGFSATSLGYLKGEFNKPTVWRGSFSGMIHYFGESFFSDSTRSITCLIGSRFENVGGENQTTLWRRFFLDYGPASGVTGQILGTVFSNYDTSTVQATFSVYQGAGLFQSRNEMGVQGKAVAFQISHSSASLPLLISGYSWANRGLRNV